MNLASVSSSPPLQLMVVPLRSQPPVSVCFPGGLRDRKRESIVNAQNTISDTMRAYNNCMLVRQRNKYFMCLCEIGCINLMATWFLVIMLDIIGLPFVVYKFKSVKTRYIIGLWWTAESGGAKLKSFPALPVGAADTYQYRHHTYKPPWEICVEWKSTSQYCEEKY